MNRTRPLALAALTASLSLLLAPTTVLAASAATTAPAGALASGGAWLADEVPADGLLPSSFGEGFKDYGLSLDVVLALEALGTDSSVADRVINAVKADTVAYTGFGDPTEKAAGATAKLLFTAVVHGDDPTDFGGRNLRQDVLDLVTPSGRVSDVSQFGDFSNTFGQAYAVLGLARTGGVAESLIGYLARQQCADGGFRTFVDDDDQTCVAAAGTSEVDSTALAVQALQAAQRAGSPSAAALVPAAVAYLKGAQQADGSFRTAGDTPVSNSSSTGLAAQALAALGEQADADEAVTFLLSLQRTSGPEAGAIAYSAADQGDTATVIPDAGRDQFRRASAQALLGLAQVSDADLGAVPGVVPPGTVVAQPTALTLVAPTALRAPATATLTGTLTSGGSPAAGRTVVVGYRLATSSGAFIPVRTVLTGGAGQWSATISPSTNVTWQASFAGTEGLLASTSTTAATRVQLSSATVGGPNTVRVGGTISYFGRVLPGAAAPQVRLQWVRPDGRLVDLTAPVTAAADGDYLLTRGFATRGTFRLRVLGLETPLNQGSSSRVFTLRVS